MPIPDPYRLNLESGRYNQKATSFSDNDKATNMKILVRKILDSTDDEKRMKILTQIDILVYHLYELSYDEILIVDPETPITRDEYEKE